MAAQVKILILWKEYMKEMHDMESHTAAAVSLWGRYTHTYTPPKKKEKEKGIWVLLFMMCRKLLWKAHVMNAVQFQEECCGKKNISCTFSSLCDLDMFYYFKHLIVLFKTSYNYSVL